MVTVSLKDLISNAQVSLQSEYIFIFIFACSALEGVECYAMLKAGEAEVEKMAIVLRV